MIRAFGAAVLMLLVAAALVALGILVALTVGEWVAWGLS
jgi:hypothetical protein